MESLSYQQLEIIVDQLNNVQTAIHQLIEWNAEVTDFESLPESSDGMKLLAADCMLIAAIGEEINRIMKKYPAILELQPEIPWHQVIGMRNHISHGYFDINETYVGAVVKNDILPLQLAINEISKVISNEIKHRNLSTDVEDHLLPI